MENNLISINFVYEDILQKEVIDKIVRTFFSKKYVITGYTCGHGFGWIKNNINVYNKASSGTTYLVLIDLDSESCPVKIVQDWLDDAKGENLLFRVAVREIESWIVADVQNFSKFLHLREKKLRKDVDEITDPKRYIFNLVSGSIIRQLSGVCPRGTARIGDDYNEKLSKFVKSSWNPQLAMANSSSLKKTINRLDIYTPRYSE
jgi:hypothetical protein